MSHAQRFQDRVQHQFQQAGSRILQLQSQIASKDDLLASKDEQLVNAHAQIQRLMAAASSSNSNPNVTLAVQTQINQAISRAMSAENNLKQSVTKFNKAYAEMQAKVRGQQKQINSLQKENMALKASDGGGMHMKLDRLGKAYKSLEGQLQAEKKQNSKGMGIPAREKGKAVATYGTNDDEDDEESSLPWLKQEPAEKGTSVPGNTAEYGKSMRASYTTAPPEMKAPPPPPSWSEFQGQRGSGCSVPVQLSPRPLLFHPTHPVRSRAPTVESSAGVHSTVPASPPTIKHEKPQTPLVQDPTSSARHESTTSELVASQRAIEPRQSQQIPPAAQSFRRPSTGGPLELIHRPRANAIDLTATVDLTLKPSPEPRPRKRRLQSLGNAESQETEIKREVRRIEIKDPVSRASLEMKNPNARTRSQSTRTSQQEVINVDSPSPPPPNKRPRTDAGDLNIAPPTTSQGSSIHGVDIEDKLIFKAIESYDDDQESFSYLHSSEDLADAASVLWEKIQELHDLWEEAKGELWDDEFKHKLANVDCKQCVSSKLRVEGRETGRSRWRPGSECRYACMQCVEEGRPCFVWKDDEFFLLPLHDDDRVWPVQEGLEVRRWINIK